MRRGWKGLLIILGAAFFLSGCGKHELEDRSFPLAVGIETAKEGCRAVFNFPVLSEVASQNAEGNYQEVRAESGTDFYAIQKNHEKNGAKQIDFSHNKVLVLGEEFLEDKGKLAKFLDYAGNQELMARNTYLFVTKMPMEDLFSLDENLEKPLGTYLEELLESDKDYDNKRIMTLGKLYDERANRMETLYIPVLEERNKAPAVTAFYVMKRGEPSGKVPAKTGMKSLLIQGKLKHFSYQDARGGEWSFTKIKPFYEFGTDLEHPVVKVRIFCQAAMENGQVSDWREEERMEQELSTELEKHLMGSAKEGLKKGYDITNSYKKLGNQFQKAYRYYEERGGYEEALRIDISVETSIVNTR